MHDSPCNDRGFSISPGSVTVAVHKRASASETAGQTPYRRIAPSSVVSVYTRVARGATASLPGGEPKKSTLLKLLVALFTLSLVAAACGSDDDTADSGDSDALAEAEAALAAAEDAIEAAEAEAAEAQAAADAAASDGGDTNPLAGTAVRITGPVRSPDEVAGLMGALDAFAEANDMTIFYVGSADWESEINVQIEASTPPDISIFPQPGKLADFARDGFLVPLPDDVTEAVSQNWSDGAMGFGNVDGTQYGVPDKTDLKSIVWYQPARFEANGYTVPTTLDELFALTETIIADGNTPFCIGIESGTATGWTFTDWVEDMMLRRHSGETYDAWTTGELLFASDEVSGVMQEVLDVWNTPGMVYAQGGTIASTSFCDNGEPLVNNVYLMFILIWIQTGFAMVILSAAIKAVPEELLEAARIDGASESEQLFNVTLPQILPTVGVVVTAILVAAAKVFDIVRVSTGGNFGTNVLATDFFDEAFSFLNRGVGSAIAVTILLIVAPVLIFNVYNMQKAEA